MSTKHPSPETLAIVGIVAQHAEDAAFLWAQRATAVQAAQFGLGDLARLDDRVEAHIDGLRVAADVGWDLCHESLDGPGEIFAASVLALESRLADRIQPILSLVANSLPLSRGTISALGWLPAAKAQPYITEWIGSRTPMFRRIGVAGAAVRRSFAVNISQLLDDTDSGVRARALRAVGELGRMDFVPLIQGQLNATDDACRFWAAWSTALLAGYMDALDVLQSFAESGTPFRERALQLALRRVDLKSAHFRQQQLAKNPQSARLAVIGAGVIGDPVVIPWLMEQMSLPPLARVAEEAFTMITGVDIAYEDLDSDKPEGFESGPTEDPNDDNVEMDPDERLPWPNPILIRKWWEKNGASFQAGIRYLLGKPITLEWMQQVLRVGRQRQRAAAALELAIMQPGTPLFEVRAPGFRQQEMLGLSRRR
jgi:uncharacterized protein (TIGR02270 family)